MWQPIETAPRDGTHVLLATPKGRIADGFWSLNYKVWSWPYVMVEPTHWMPLLDRPGAQPAQSIPEGWKLVPVEVVDLYSFMCAAFVPMTPQQEQIALQLDLAKQAMLAAAPRPEGE